MGGKKRISLVTWIGDGNFGTCLQSFALHEYLKRQGYAVSIVTMWPKTKGIKSYIKAIAKRVGLLRLKEMWRLRKAGSRLKKLNSFVRQGYNFPELITERQRKQYLKKTDVFITGSDQIWNTYFGFDPTMFLSFAENNKRVAYASSIGTNNIKEEYKNVICDNYEC